jgi:hypothetical protein
MSIASAVQLRRRTALLTAIAIYVGIHGTLLVAEIGSEGHLFIRQSLFQFAKVVFFGINLRRAPLRRFRANLNIEAKRGDGLAGALAIIAKRLQIREAPIFVGLATESSEGDAVIVSIVLRPEEMSALITCNHRGGSRPHVRIKNHMASIGCRQNDPGN